MVSFKCAGARSLWSPIASDFQAFGHSKTNLRVKSPELKQVMRKCLLLEKMKERAPVQVDVNKMQKRFHRVEQQKRF